MNVQLGYGMMGARGMYDGGLLGIGGYGGFGLLALIGFVIIAAIVIGLIIWAVARKSSSAHGSASNVPTHAAPAEDTALATARDRLARGEIEPEQYVAIVNALNGTSSPSTSG